MAGEFDDVARWGEVVAQDRDFVGCFDWVGEWVDHFLVFGFACFFGVLADRLVGYCDRVVV